MIRGGCLTLVVAVMYCAEKHKVYHQKDEALSRDGFKKFMKYEECQFAGCIYSHLSNHIHCIRPGAVGLLLIFYLLFTTGVVTVRRIPLVVPVCVHYVGLWSLNAMPDIPKVFPD